MQRTEAFDTMPPRRRVIDQRADPANPKNRRYILECGHEVSRRTNSNKRSACCTECR